MAIVSKKKQSEQARFAELVTKRYMLKQDEARIKSELGKVEDEIKEILKARGIRDGKGSYNLQHENNSVRYEAYSRTSVVLEAVREAMKTNTLLQAYATLDAKAIEQAVKDGVLTKDDAKRLVKVNTSHRLMVREITESEDDGYGEVEE